MKQRKRTQSQAMAQRPPLGERQQQQQKKQDDKLLSRTFEQQDDKGRARCCKCGKKKMRIQFSDREWAKPFAATCNSCCRKQHSTMSEPGAANKRTPPPQLDEEEEERGAKSTTSAASVEQTHEIDKTAGMKQPSTAEESEEDQSSLETKRSGKKCIICNMTMDSTKYSTYEWKKRLPSCEKCLSLVMCTECGEHLPDTCFSEEQRKQPTFRLKNTCNDCWAKHAEALERNLTRMCSALDEEQLRKIAKERHDRIGNLDDALCIPLQFREGFCPIEKQISKEDYHLYQPGKILQVRIAGWNERYQEGHIPEQAEVEEQLETYGYEVRYVNEKDRLCCAKVRRDHLEAHLTKYFVAVMTKKCIRDVRLQYSEDGWMRIEDWHCRPFFMDCRPTSARPRATKFQGIEMFVEVKGKTRFVVVGDDFFDRQMKEQLFSMRPAFVEQVPKQIPVPVLDEMRVRRKAQLMAWFKIPTKCQRTFLEFAALSEHVKPNGSAMKPTWKYTKPAKLKAQQEQDVRLEKRRSRMVEYAEELERLDLHVKDDYECVENCKVCGMQVKEAKKLINKVTLDTRELGSEIAEGLTALYFECTTEEGQCCNLLRCYYRSLSEAKEALNRSRAQISQIRKAIVVHSLATIEGHAEEITTKASPATRLKIGCSYETLTYPEVQQRMLETNAFFKPKKETQAKPMNLRQTATSSSTFTSSDGTFTDVKPRNKVRFEEVHQRLEYAVMGRVCSKNCPESHLYEYSPCKQWRIEPRTEEESSTTATETGEKLADKPADRSSASLSEYSMLLLEPTCFTSTGRMKKVEWCSTSKGEIKQAECFRGCEQWKGLSATLYTHPCGWCGAIKGISMYHPNEWKETTSICSSCVKDSIFCSKCMRKKINEEELDNCEECNSLSVECNRCGDEIPRKQLEKTDERVCMNCSRRESNSSMPSRAFTANVRMVENSFSAHARKPPANTDELGRTPSSRLDLRRTAAKTKNVTVATKVADGSQPGNTEAPSSSKTSVLDRNNRTAETAEMTLVPKSPTTRASPHGSAEETPPCPSAHATVGVDNFDVASVDDEESDPDEPPLEADEASRPYVGKPLGSGGGDLAWLNIGKTKTCETYYYQPEYERYSQTWKEGEEVQSALPKGSGGGDLAWLNPGDREWWKI